jgi:DNA-binding transcriptional regulator YdaS (Cro superfamily)
MIDQETRRQHFNEATELLGGQRAVARILRITDRSVRNLCSGKTDIKIAFMREITTALEARARACARVSRATDPLFSANWTAAEQAERDARREGRRG